MTERCQAIKTPIKGRYSQLDLEERNEYLQEELKVCRKKMEELQADVACLTSELRVAEKNELLASREAGSFVIAWHFLKPKLESI